MAETFEKPKGFKKKLENFWYHHKMKVLLVAFFVFSFTFLIVDYVKKKEPDMVLVYVGQEYGDKTQFVRLEKDFKSVVGDVNGDGRQQLNYRLIVIRNNWSDLTISKEQEFNYAFLDKNVRLFVIEDRFFDQKKQFFEPLEGILPAEALENGLKNDEGKVCAVPLAGNPRAGEMNFDRPGMYVGIKRIIDTEKHEKLVPAQHEKAIELIRYIVLGEK